MDPSALLTFLSLIAAIYAVIPSAKKLDLRIRLNWIDYAIIVIALCLIHYFSFPDIFHSILSLPSLFPWYWGFDSNSASYFIITIASIIVAVRAIKASLRKNKIKVFFELTEELFHESRFNELLFLIQKHFADLIKIYKNDFWINRLSMRLPVFARVLSSDKNESFIAQEVIRRVCLTEDFVLFLAKHRPYFALNILRFDFSLRRGFLFFYIRSLLSFKESILFFEIQNYQNTNSLYRYSIDERDRLISFFLKDVRVAERLAIWTPFGEYAKGFLDKANQNETYRMYNDPLFNYHQESRWRCPLHSCIHFYDLMVSEALFQEIEWHMWLYDMYEIAKKIIQNISPSYQVELCREWPTPYHFLLYKIIDSFQKWISAVGEIPPNQKNIILKHDELVHENDNIPKSAIMALGWTLDSIITAKTLDKQFKKYIFDIVIRLLEDLIKNQKTNQYGKTLEKAIIKGGFANRRAHLVELYELWKELDPVLTLEMAYFEKVLEAEIKNESDSGFPLSRE